MPPKKSMQRAPPVHSAELAQSWAPPPGPPPPQDGAQVALPLAPPKRPQQTLPPVQLALLVQERAPPWQFAPLAMQLAPTWVRQHASPGSVHVAVPQVSVLGLEASETLASAWGGGPPSRLVGGGTGVVVPVLGGELVPVPVPVGVAVLVGVLVPLVPESSSGTVASEPPHAAAATVNAVTTPKSAPTRTTCFMAWRVDFVRRK
jgi:hypothetical protein